MTQETNNLLNIECEITKIIKRFDNGYTILNVKLNKKNATLVGVMPLLTVGLTVKATVESLMHPLHGVQYKVHEIEPSKFNDKEALVKYLSSSVFKGIGIATAKAIVDHFGMNTIDVLDKNPDKISEVEGLHSKAEKLKEQWIAERNTHKIITALMKFGIPVNICLKINKHFGDQSLKVIAENPYLLTQVPSIGFKTADDISLKQGVARNSPQRVNAAVIYALTESMNQEGHCYLKMEELANKVVHPKILDGDVNRYVVSESIRRLEDRELKIIGDKVYLVNVYMAETFCAKRISDMLKHKEGMKIKDYEELHEKLEELKDDGIELASEQIDAIFTALNSRVCIITGGPGVGKTTITKKICHFMRHYNIQYLLTSPTGRAAKRLSESTGNEAKTIHRLLGSKGDGFEYCEGNPLKTHCVIVDEVSMVDVLLFRHLLAAMEPDDRLILIGDSDQLPSVGPGNVLSDLISSGEIPVVRLQHVFRQSAGSSIITAAHAIKNGIVPDLPTPKNAKGQNCMFISSGEETTLRTFALKMITEQLPKLGYKPEDVQILTPMRKGTLGVWELNDELQKIMNPYSDDKAEVKSGNQIFRAGDKIMQIRNNYDKEVFNGDIGRIVGIDFSTGNPVVHVKYPDLDYATEYTSNEWEDLELAYCNTIHKCIAENEKIWTRNKGLVSIKNIEEGDIVNTGFGFNKVKSKFNSGIKNSFNLKTKMGYEINASKEHPLLVHENGKNIFKKLEDIKQGDIICINRTNQQDCEYKATPQLQKLNNNINSDIIIPKVIDEDLAWLLGVIFGNGSLRDVKDGTINIKSCDLEVINKIKNILSSYNLNVCEYQPPNNKSKRISVVSKVFRQWLFDMGLGYEIARNKKIPHGIFESPISVKGSFLRGLFDTDGSMTKLICRLLTSSQALCKDTQELLLSLNILSYVSQSRVEFGDYFAYTLNISGKSLLTFSKIVGFTVKHKSDNLQNCVENITGKSNNDFIPNSATLLSQFKECYNQKHPQTQGIKGMGLSSKNSPVKNILIKKQKNISYSNLHVINDFLVSSDVEVPPLISQVLSENIFYDTVKSINMQGTSVMYDIEVEGQHSFVSNGFICHNSQGSEYPVVVLFNHNAHYFMLQRNLFYTGLTRAKKLCIVAGTQSAIKISVENSKQKTRNTTLSENIKKHKSTIVIQ